MYYYIGLIVLVASAVFATNGIRWFGQFVALRDPARGQVLIERQNEANKRLANFFSVQLNTRLVLGVFFIGVLTGVFVLALIIDLPPKDSEPQNIDNTYLDISPSRSAFEGNVWKLEILDNPKFAFLYETDKTDSVNDTNNWLLTENSPFIFYKKSVDETPPQVLKRLFVDTISDPYKRKHCVVELDQRPILDDFLNDVPFLDSRKSAWVINPDEEYAKIFFVPGDLPPNDACPYGLFSHEQVRYFEFHLNSPTMFVRVRAYQDTPFFDEQSLTF